MNLLTGNPNRIAILGCLLALSSLVFLSFLELKANRLIAGKGYRVLEMGTAGWWLLSLVFLAGLSAFLMPRFRAPALAILGNLVFIASIILIGTDANQLLDSSTLARVSLAPAAWLMLVASSFLIFAALNDLENIWFKRLTSSVGILVFVVILLTGGLSSLSVIREYQTRLDTFWLEVGRHLGLAFLALFTSSLFGIPLGFWAARSKRFEGFILGLSSLLQTIPSLALLALLITPFSALVRAFPILETVGIRGIGFAPAITALTVYGLLPIARGVLNGLKAVPETALEAGRGMGMTSVQLFLSIELPLALGLILNGIRTSAVQLVGLSTLSSLIGAGGLGVFIFGGLGSAANDLVLLGAIPVLVLAVLTDAGFRTLEQASIPKGLR
jgi:osmoprotectant transport system permease protein